ncbi:uroporphyrinogen-III C-methyltransferase [Microbacterium esteraromaticum]|nr:uroporphyrinogen-III C-methyltransferase [Microbacterium esteraromaticum]
MEAAAPGRRAPDLGPHRAALGGVGARGDHLVRAERCHRLLRDPDGRDPVDRERTALGHRPGAAAAAPGGHRAGGEPVAAGHRGDAARRTAGLLRRSEAGLGVLVALAHGRRDHHERRLDRLRPRHHAQPVARAGGSRRSARHHPAHPRDRHRHRAGAVRPGGATHAAQPRTAAWRHPMTTTATPAGTVTLVGAGPGDAGLLTLRGLRALERADVIVADRLGARSVLAQLEAEGAVIAAEVIDVGKLPGHHRVPQDAINELLVELAQAGREVVRLKGGDPFVFGRGREEQLFCEAVGVRVEVVPGVTSAVSVPAVAGIPLTHRGVAASFSVVSAHDQIEPGGPLSTSGADHTLVLLMGVSTLAHSAHVLAAGARGIDCPVAIIEDGYGTGERVTTGTLGTIAHLAAARQVRSPAVVVIGEVVRLSPFAASLEPASADAGDAAPPPASPPARRRPRSRLAAALDAGLAVDTGLIRAIDVHSSPSPSRKVSLS